VPKAIRFGLVRTSRSHELLESFGATVNHAIYIRLEEKIKGRLKLRTESTRSFRRATSSHRHTDEAVKGNGATTVPILRAESLKSAGLACPAKPTELVIK
jgi:hypothetical protein